MTDSSQLSFNYQTFGGGGSSSDPIMLDRCKKVNDALFLTYKAVCIVLAKYSPSNFIERIVS